MATTARRDTSRLASLHARAAMELGYQPASAVVDRFNLEQHLDLVREFFPTTDSVLRYYASGPIDAIENPASNGTHRQQLLAIVRAQVEQIIDSEGVFRDPKPAGCFAATRSP